MTDTREKLEADLLALTKSWHDYDGNFMKIYASVAYAQVRELLDRQAALTRAECDRPNWEYCDTCELQAERDKLKAENKDLHCRVNGLLVEQLIIAERLGVEI